MGYLHVYVYISLCIVKTYVDNDDVYGIIRFSNVAFDTSGQYQFYLY